MSAPTGPHRLPYGPPPRPPKRPSNTARNVIVSIACTVLLGVLITVIVVLVSKGGDSTPAAEDVATNERGNVEAEIGEPVDLTDVTGAVVAHLTVTGIEVTEQTAGDLDNPHHVIAIRVEVETTIAATDLWTIGTYGWQVIGPDGKTVNTTQAMTNDEEVPQLGPSQSAEGVIALGAPVTSGILIYQQPFSTGPSYEWEFGE